jgi:hypothetical protein
MVNERLLLCFCIALLQVFASNINTSLFALPGSRERTGLWSKKLLPRGLRTPESILRQILKTLIPLSEYYWADYIKEEMGGHVARMG